MPRTKNVYHIIISNKTIFKHVWFVLLNIIIVTAGLGNRWPYALRIRRDKRANRRLERKTKMRQSNRQNMLCIVCTSLFNSSIAIYAIVLDLTNNIIIIL